MASPPPILIASTSAPTRQRPMLGDTSASTSTRVSLSVSTRSMARNRTGPLGQTGFTVGSTIGGLSYTERSSRVMVGGKRKSSENEEEGRKRKVSRFSSEDVRMALPSPPPKPDQIPPSNESVGVGRLDGPSTPTRPIQAVPVPTPARDLLKAGYRATDEDSHTPPESSREFIVKPPTPPRMKPRPPVVPTAASTTPPRTPGKRCLSPTEEDMRSVKRSVHGPIPVPSADVVVLNENPSTSISVPKVEEPTTPSRPTTLPDITMKSATKFLSIPSARKTVPSPHRALASISRLNTPGRPTAGCDLIAKHIGNTPSSMKPTVPVPFSFSTPRGSTNSRLTTADNKATSQQDLFPKPTLSSFLGARESSDLRAEAQKEIKALPRRTVMAPPSKIPVRTSKSSLPPVSAPIPPAAGSSKPKPSLGVAERRPMRRAASGQGPSKTLAVFDENAAAAAGGAQTTEAPVRRKPSYPSSLGSGPLAQPRARLVSGSVIPPRSFTAPSSASTGSQMEIDNHDPTRATPRSVSDPISRPRPSLASSTSSRREGFTADTSRSLAGLSDALAKLKVKKDTTQLSASGRQALSVPNRPKPSVLAEVIDLPNTNKHGHVNGSASSSSSTSARLTSVHRPRSSILGADVSMTEEGDRSIAALMCSTGSSKALRGVVAFVDVRTDDGGCAGDIWSEMLRGLGAKVRHRVSLSSGEPLMCR